MDGGLVVFFILIALAATLLTGVYYWLRRRFFIRKYGRALGLKLLSGTPWNGMTAEQLEDMWGKPDVVEHAVSKEKTKETWKFHQTAKNKFQDRIILEGGKVVGFNTEEVIQSDTAYEAQQAIKNLNRALKEVAKRSK